MKLVYVFDYMNADVNSYVMRVPEFVARLICRYARRTWDYADSPAGV